ncbi:MAG: Dps family protein [Chloroflexota bacterium]
MNAVATNPNSAVVVTDLQATLVELVDLSLLGKQAHWNVVGPNFRSIHLQLDEIVDAARLSSDRVAERLATIGAVPDGRAPAAAASGLPEFPGGQVPVAETVQRISATVDAMSERLRERILRIGDVDPVSQDILISTADELEKQAWMLRAQLDR